jgi:hypothetical protein
MNNDLYTDVPIPAKKIMRSLPISVIIATSFIPLLQPFAKVASYWKFFMVDPKTVLPVQKTVVQHVELNPIPRYLTRDFEESWKRVRESNL